MRSIGLDIHRDFLEVAIAEGGEIRSCPRVAMDPASLELFAQSLGADDQVALEVSGNAWEVVRLIRPHVARIVAASPTDTGMRQARAKTDRLDARALAPFLPPASSRRSGSPTRRRRQCGDGFSAEASSSTPGPRPRTRSTRR